MKINALVLTLASLSLAACDNGGSGDIANTGREAWVSVDRLNQRTCPNPRCGSIGELYFREKATIYEESMGWGRISKYYDAFCKGGRSEYIIDGNDRCEPSNGIVDGQVAQWVAMEYLSTDRPADPGAGATGDLALVSGSDDYRIYKDVFAKAAAELIASGKCTRADFEEMGGWIKSVNHRTLPVYFTYCGGMRRENRLYLNAANGRVSKAM